MTLAKVLSKEFQNVKIFAHTIFPIDMHILYPGNEVWRTGFRQICLEKLYGQMNVHL